VFITIKDNKVVSGFSQTQQYIFIFIFDVMFRSIERHQALFTELIIRCMQCK
jgi:hypothetical protein